MRFLLICGLSMAVLVLASVFPAEAARSGGRAGGSSFSSRSSSSSSSPSRSSSAPSRASYSSSSHSSSSSYSAPTTIYVQSSCDAFLPSMPTPRADATGMASSIGASVESIPASPAVTDAHNGSSFFDLLILTILIYCTIYFTISAIGEKIIISSSKQRAVEIPSNTMTVAKVQVGLRGPTKALKRDLDALAARADTSTPQGLHKLLQESAVLLLRNPGSYAYGTSDSSQLALQKAEGAFTRMSLEERSKFREETLSNVKGITRRGPLLYLSNALGGVDEMIVVTLLLVTEGRVSMPLIRKSADVKACLTALKGVGRTQVVALEVLWTPQVADDYYTKEELLADYPNMAAL